MRKTPVNLLMILMSVAVGAKTVAAQQQAPPPPSQFKMTSVFSNGDWIPVQYTCGVPDFSSPGVQWSDGGCAEREPQCGDE